MGIPLNDNIKINAPKPSDPRYFADDNTPWASIVAVEAGIPLTERHPELEVDVMGTIYWWKDGAWVLRESDLVHKTGNETIDGVKSFKKSIKIDSDEPLDAKYLNGTVAYASLEEANTLIPIGIRSPYLTIVVQGVEYWWKDGAWQLKTPHITKTLTEINALIASNGLIKGALYKITGCQTTLYGGTDLYLRALEINKLDQKGVGKFFTPKYENISGNGIWTGYVECGVSTIVGLFDVNELVTANNGATGQLFGNVNGGFITPLTGTWSSATSITGNASGATAVISSVSVPLTYAIGDKTIWGGYHWSNLTGALGSKVDDFNLDATNWVKVAYNTTDYNLSFDEIGYDVTSDFISYRNDNLGNEISYSYADYSYFSTIWGIALNTIKVFQWGNFKVLGNNLKTSFVNVLNFRGSDIQNLTFTQNSIISGNTFGKGSKLLNSLFQYGAILNSVFGKDSVISNSNFRQTSNIQISTFGEGSSINDILNQGSSIINVVFCKNAKIQKCTFNINTGINNVTLNQSKVITSTIFESNSQLISIDLSSATVIFEPFSKTVFARASDGIRKIRYYNNYNVLVIADITD